MSNILVSGDAQDDSCYGEYSHIGGSGEDLVINTQSIIVPLAVVGAIELETAAAVNNTTIQSINHLHITFALV